MALSDAQIYNGDGSTRDFTILGEILSESHLRVWIDDVLQSSDDWDLLGNTVLFNDAPDDGANVQFLVSTTGTDFPSNPSAIGDVSININDVITVAANIGIINTVSTNINDAIAVGSNIDNVNDVASNKTNIDNVVNNKTNIDTVANNKTNIDTIATNINDVIVVSSNIDNVNGVASNKTNIDNVVNNKTNIDTVATNINDVLVVSNNIEEVKILNTAIEDGVLPFERIVVTVNNIDELLEVSPSNGDTVIVKDNNRGGTFIYDATQSAVNNSGTIFDGWVRQYSGAVNVKWFGAKGDGISDDTVAIQNTINYLSLDTYIYSPNYSGGGIVIVPNGKFRVTDTIYLTRGIALKGNLSSATFGYVPTGTNSMSTIFGDFIDEGKIIIDTATYIVTTGEHVPPKALINGSDVIDKVVTQTHAISIEDICVYGNGITMTAIRLISSPSVSVNNILVNGGVDYGIIFQACWAASSNNCNVISNKVGVAYIDSCYGFNSTGMYTTTPSSPLDPLEVPYFYPNTHIGNADINPMEVYTARVGIYINESNGTLTSSINEKSAIGLVARNARLVLNAPHYEQLAYVLSFTYYSHIIFNAATAIHNNKKLMYAAAGSQIDFSISNNISNLYADYFEYYSFTDSRAVIDGARKTAATDSISNIRRVQEEYPSKAWVQFDGGATPYIRYSKNIKAITRKGVGWLYIEFGEPMPDTYYAVNVTAGNFTYMNTGTITQVTWGKPTVYGFEISVTDANNLPADSSLISVTVYR